MALDWPAHRLHRQAVAQDQGQWIGLADENCQPLMTLPPPQSLTAPETRLAPQSVKATFGVRSRSGVVHPIVDELVAEQLGQTDAQGQLVSAVDRTRFLVVERPGIPRRAFKITHAVASGTGHAPAQLAVHGTDMLRMLSDIPAMSAPTTWTGEWTTFTRDWAGPEDQGILFDQPRDLAGIKLVTVADGATIEGPAEATIRRLITESLAAAFRVAGVDDHPVQVVPTPTGKTSPNIMIRPTDKPLWEEIAALCLAAGVRVSATMWWPTDPQPPGLALTLPTVVVRVEQVQEVI